MAHNSRKNKHYNDTEEGDDYVYPTKKIRETKTRNRRYAKNLIQAGINEYEHPEDFIEDEDDMLQTYEEAEDALEWEDDYERQQEEDDHYDDSVEWDSCYDYRRDY